MIAFRTGGGAAMGWGHLVRSLAIADEVKRLGVPTAFVVDGDPGLARELGADRHAIVPLSSSDPAATLAGVKQAGAHAVLLDGYTLGDDHEKLLADAGLFVAALDDFGHATHRRASLIVNSNLHYCDIERYPSATRARRLLGPAYAPLRGDIVRARKSAPAVNADVERVVVVMGGSDAGGSREDVLDMLAQELPATAQITVAGPAAARAQADRIRWVRSLSEVAEALSQADIGISAGGMTSYELAYLGVPALLLPATAQEEPVSRQLEALGCSVCLPLPGARDKAALAHAFRRVASSRESRQSMSAAGRALFDGLGATRIAQALVDV